MGYLLSQILVSLLFASVVGGAIGWILHGYKAHQREQRLRESLDRQGMVLQQAQSERQMIADDFDELKMHLEGRISDLQVQTREIPKLEENLDKSQTLVRQMMQKHDSELMDIDGTNRKLQLELDSLKQREKNHEAEIIALKKVRDEQMESANTPAKGVTRQVAAASTLAVTAGLAAAGVSQHVDISSSKLSGNVAEELTAANTSDDALASSGTLSLADQTMPEEQTSLDLSGDGLNVIPDNTAFADSLSEDDLDELTEFEADTYRELQLLDDDSVYSNRDDADDDNLEEEALESVYAQTFFSDSDTIDDLKSIHGIGPVIEQSLNDIGITSYQQIAELSRKQIQEIADILEIFPGRIERDNWIGSAKKLVSEELEEA